MSFLRKIFSLLLTILLHQTIIAQADHKEEPFTVESYYKVQWGHAEEFMTLWKKNHYPLEKEAMKKGEIISISAEKPKLHSGEDTRWDWKITITYKNSAAAFDHDLTAPYKKQIYPDLEKLAKDEQHRWDLVIAHWDVMTEKIELD